MGQKMLRGGMASGDWDKCSPIPGPISRGVHRIWFSEVIQDRQSYSVIIISVGSFIFYFLCEGGVGFAILTIEYTYIILIYSSPLSLSFPISVVLSLSQTLITQKVQGGGRRLPQNRPEGACPPCPPRKNELFSLQ